MKRTGKEIVRFILIAILVIAFVLLISLVINRKNKTEDTPQTNPVIKSLDATTNNSTQGNEDDDVYGQRQLRSDYNTGSSSDGY